MRTKYCLQYCINILVSNIQYIIQYCIQNIVHNVNISYNIAYNTVLPYWLDWKLLLREVSYQDISNSIADSCTIIIAIHLSCASKVEPIMLKTPPSVTPRPIGAFIWEPFNRIEHFLSHGRDDKEFDSRKMITTIPKLVASAQSCGIMIKYHLHCSDSDATILAGSSVLSSGGLCPPFESCPN